MGKARQLSKFQRGILQDVAVSCVYIICILSALFLFARLIKFNFISLVDREQQQGELDSEFARRLKEIINAPSAFDFFLIILIGVVCVFAIRLLLRRIAALNWSWPVVLPDVVEFSSAMRSMNIFDFSDQMACIHKHRLRIYIADAPIHGERQENVRTKLYPYAHNELLRLENVIATNIGKRQLCLDVDDFEPIYQQYTQTNQIGSSARAAELERNIDALKIALATKDAENDRLTEENVRLQKDNDRFRKKEQTTPARGGRSQKGEQRKVIFWRVAGPLINRLIEEAGPGIQYTRPQIQTEFLEELEKYPELKPGIANLLQTAKKKVEGAQFDLTGWAMELIRDGLGEYARKEGGAARKRLKTTEG